MHRYGTPLCLLSLELRCTDSRRALARRTHLSQLVQAARRPALRAVSMSRSPAGEWCRRRNLCTERQQEADNCGSRRDAAGSRGKLI